jgi:alpha-methylacyl-CoA racemase
MGMIYGRLAPGIWKDQRASNTIDGGSHWYNTYQCKDGKWFAVGAYEKKFYDNLVAAMGFPDPETFDTQQDRDRWPELKARFATRFAEKTQAEWAEILGATETCSSPILSMEEAIADPDNVERQVFSKIDGVDHPNPAPRFSGSPDIAPGKIGMVGDDQDATLADWGLGESEIAELHENGVLKDL